MRIAFIIPGNVGGGVRSVMRVATGLIGRGHELTVYFREYPPDLRERLRQLYFALRYRRKEGWLNSFQGRIVPYRKLSADVVGNHDFIIAVGVSCVLEFQDLPDRCGIKINNNRGIETWGLEKMYEAFALPMPRIVVNPHIARVMREAGSTDPIYVVPNGVDAQNYFPSVPESKRDGVGVVYHGGGVKDPELIIAVLNRLAQRRPKLPFYVFSSYPRPAGLPATTVYVRFPTLAVARDLYSRSLVWFVASRSEGLPNPLLEAASCGCALVSTDWGGVGEVIEHGRSGLIVPIGDADAMVVAIERLLDDKGLREEFRQNAKETVRRYNWEPAIDLFEQTLIEIAKNGMAHRGSHELAS